MANRRRYLVVVGILVAVVALPILIHTKLTNHQPVVIGLEAEPDTVLPSGSCQIVCNATDPDGDELGYSWSASGGAMTGEGATVSWIAPDSEVSYSHLVSVVVTDGRGGEVTDHINVTVITDKTPTINSLSTSADWTAPLRTIEIVCNATDPFGDGLRYEWTASAGTISGTGAAVSWIAPQEAGVYYVTVVVESGEGWEATEFAYVSVATGTPPTVQGLTVTAKEPKYLKTASSGYTVGRTKQYEIACDVSRPSSGVSYNWSCGSGVISGQGAMITWTAPDQSLDRTIVTVIVSDAYGNMVAKDIAFTVASCTPCTFG